LTRVVWITGASSGLGREVALQLAKRGMKVAISARGEDALKEVAAEFSSARASDGGIYPYPLDTTDEAACASVVERIEADLGAIDLAILNAGTHIPTPADNLVVEPFRKLMDVNVMGTVHCLCPLAQAMMQRRAGHIAIVSSVAGYSGLPTAAAYGASKAALINMAEALKIDLEPFDVRVSLVNPGFVRTPLTDKNEFPMPFLMEVEPAAARMISGLLEKSGFEVTFPRRFTYMLKFLRILPYGIYFALTRRATKPTSK